MLQELVLLACSETEKIVLTRKFYSNILYYLIHNNKAWLRSQNLKEMPIEKKLIDIIKYRELHIFSYCLPVYELNHNIMIRNLMFKTLSLVSSADYLYISYSKSPCRRLQANQSHFFEHFFCSIINFVIGVSSWFIYQSLSSTDNCDCCKMSFSFLLHVRFLLFFLIIFYMTFKLDRCYSLIIVKK